MTSENSKSVQDVFLNHLCENKIPLMVFLVSGVKLDGILIQHDTSSLLLNRDNQYQLIQKHAIASVMPKIDLPLSQNSKID